MKPAPTTHFESWLSQLYYYLITNLLVDERMESYHDLDKEYWGEFYMAGYTPRDSVKVYSGWIG